MTFHHKLLVSLFTAVAVLALGPRVGWAESPHSVSVGARRHIEQSVFKDLTFRNGDFSYALAYQYTQGVAIWQLAFDVGPDVSGQKGVVDGATTNQVGTDFILTPQMNVIFKDRCFRGGGGIRTSYLRYSDGNGEWLDPYWQLQLGLSFPLIYRFSLDVSAYYVYERWDKLPEFKFGDIEYGAWLNLDF